MSALGQARVGSASQEPVGLGERRLQIDRSGPFFVSFLAHSYGYEPANPTKTVLAWANFRFDAPSPTGSSSNKACANAESRSTRSTTVCLKLRVRRVARLQSNLGGGDLCGSVWIKTVEPRFIRIRAVVFASRQQQNVLFDLR